MVENQFEQNDASIDVFHLLHSDQRINGTAAAAAVLTIGFNIHYREYDIKYH